MPNSRWMEATGRVKELVEMLEVCKLENLRIKMLNSSFVKIDPVSAVKVETIMNELNEKVVDFVEKG